MKLIFRWVRPILGCLVLLWERVFRPAVEVQRSAEEQKVVDQRLQSLALYEFLTCPFCVKVRQELRRLGIDIVRRDAQSPGQWRDELQEHGGKIQVPCLRIEQSDQVVWMYESDEIIAYLRQQFS